MPYLSKRVITNYLRSDCQRRLRLDLSPDIKQYQQERQQQAMPPRDVMRPGLKALAVAGEEWERAKLRDLAQTFGRGAIVGRSKQGDDPLAFDSTPLEDALRAASAGQFILQGQLEVTAAFEQALGIDHYRESLGLSFAALIPDIIQVARPGTFNKALTPRGEVLHLAHNDQRTQLRVIDIKLTAEPSVAHFAEVTYYALALAGWIEDHGLADTYVVVPNAAVWPGSHDASELVRLFNERRAEGTTPAKEELLAALDEDLEKVAIEVFVARLNTFFHQELPDVLPSPWQTLPWFVDNRCIGCDYLGYAWQGATPHPRHCYPTAEREGRLCRVAFMTRGAITTLGESEIGDVDTLARTPPEHEAYNTHHTLRATRSMIQGRAKSLQTGETNLPAHAGTSAVMPRWTDLRICITADFDIGSGITLAFGLKAFWWVKEERVAQGVGNTERWGPKIFPVESRDLQVEKRELLRLLDSIHAIMQTAKDRTENSSMQVYVWDAVTYNHLARVIGRHLPSIIQEQRLVHLAWLFPPEEVLPNPVLTTKRTPITIIRNIVRSVVAVPVPHYYSLLETARHYSGTRTPEQWTSFTVPDFFEDPLSDQIPSERAHQIWTRDTGWTRQLRDLERTVIVKLTALESVTQRLAEDLKERLPWAAPYIRDISSPTLPNRMAQDSRLWFTFASLDAALRKLDIHEVRAMPPHEREARFRSARLHRRLQGEEANRRLQSMGVQPAAHRWVFELRPNSREVKVREGEFLFALAPERQAEFLDTTLERIMGGASIPLPGSNAHRSRMENVCKVTIISIDRDNGYLVLDLDSWWADTVLALERQELLSFQRDVVLDPVFRDYFTDRLCETLRAIGNPEIATTAPAVDHALGRVRRGGATAHSPVADVLWNAPALVAAPIDRSLAPVRAVLESTGVNLDQSQWAAWQAALTHRLRLIWGPPGTGKSRTLRATIIGAILAAQRPIRILLCGPTYEAIDNVLFPVYQWLEEYADHAHSVEVVRLRSMRRPADPSTPAAIDIDGNKAELARLHHALAAANSTILVATTPIQVYKLLSADENEPVQPFFDLIAIDEASQMDVGHATVALAGLADDGAVVITGDPLQLAPIHEAEPPRGLEYMVGSIYEYLRRRHTLEPVSLLKNYRSNQEIVDFACSAGYATDLHAHSPRLRLSLTSPLPTTKPDEWPADLFWTQEWAAMLDPEQPVTCFVYEEGRSSQWNPFEASTVATLIWLLAGRIDTQLRDEIAPETRAPLAPTGMPYPPDTFWAEAVGVVTPHRAQAALIVAQLQRLCGQRGNSAAIRSAVDTVERFQGQQRDVIIATYALGDPDAIRDEEDFLLSLNRFNVMASRARAKLIVLVSQEIVNHLAQNIETLNDSRLLKAFTEIYCNQSRTMTLGFQERSVTGSFRWHE